MRFDVGLMHGDLAWNHETVFGVQTLKLVIVEIPFEVFKIVPSNSSTTIVVADVDLVIKLFELVDAYDVPGMNFASADMGCQGNRDVPDAREIPFPSPVDKLLLAVLQCGGQFMILAYAASNRDREASGEETVVGVAFWRLFDPFVEVIHDGDIQCFQCLEIEADLTIGIPGSSCEWSELKLGQVECSRLAPFLASNEPYLRHICSKSVVLIAIPIGILFSDICVSVPDFL